MAKTADLGINLKGSKAKTIKGLGIYGLWKYTGCFQIKKVKVFRKKTE